MNILIYAAHFFRYAKKNKMTASLEKLDEHFFTYRKSSPYDDAMRHYTFETFRPYLDRQQGTALEFGCSDGQMTEMIASCVEKLDVVEGSKQFIQKAQERKIPNASFTHSLFEFFSSAKKYDYIFASYVLTHISDLKLFFTKVKELLNADGLFFAAVPNSRTLSRQLAQNMGLLDDLFSLSENDKNHGHCRPYDRVRLNKDLDNNGFIMIAQGGIILKPLADFQMDKLIQDEILKKEQMDGLYKLGMEYPDLSAAIYAVCKKNNL